MEFLNFVSGDNIFKYCFTLGVVMIVFSLVYPLQKKNEIEIEIITHNKDVLLLNNEIIELKKFVNETGKVADSLKRNQKQAKKRWFKELAKVLNKNLATASEKGKELRVKEITLHFNEDKIRTLQSQADTFNSFATWLKFIGIILSLFGFIFWTISTFKDWGSKKNK